MRMAASASQPFVFGQEVRFPFCFLKQITFTIAALRQTEIVQIARAWKNTSKLPALPYGLLLVANVGGEYYAIGSICTHEGGDLAEGWIDGREVTCPLHGSVFDLATGEVAGPPADKPVPLFDVRIEGDEIQVTRRGPA